ncbi:MAG TPA: hypothetical protein VLI69_09340 [Gammaproteobacteria bacterium]|nr:hypothetical protein [Gammaproteobacteria bacterium]
MSEFDKNKGFGKEKDLGKTGQMPGGARQTGTPGQPIGGVNQNQKGTTTQGGTGNLNKQQQWNKDKLDKQR